MNRWESVGPVDPKRIFLLCLLLLFFITAPAQMAAAPGENEKSYAAGKTLCQVPEGAKVYDVWLERDPSSMRAYGVTVSGGEYVRVFWLDAADGTYEWQQNHEKLQLLTLVKEDRLEIPKSFRAIAGEKVNVALFRVSDNDAQEDFLSFTLYSVQGKKRDLVQMVEVKVRGSYYPGIGELRRGQP